MSLITRNSIISRNGDITFGELEGEIVMINIEIGKYFNLGNTGSVIWHRLDRPMSVEALVQNLMDEYQVDEEQCERDVIGFLNELNKEGLIIVK